MYIFCSKDVTFPFLYFSISQYKQKSNRPYEKLAGAAKFIHFLPLPS